MKFLTILFLIILFSGCPSSPIRTAETLQLGQAATGLQFNVALPAADFEGRKANAVERVLGGALFTAAFGLPAQCDIMGTFGPASRLFSAEARCGILQRRNGSPVAVAPGGGIAWGPRLFLSTESGFEFKGFLDVDAKFGVFVPLSRVEYAQGTFYSVKLGGGSPRGGSIWTHEAGFARRLSITGGLGLELLAESPNPGTIATPYLLVAAVTRYWVFDANGGNASAPGWTGTIGFEIRFE